MFDNATVDRFGESTVANPGLHDARHNPEISGQRFPDYSFGTHEAMEAERAPLM